MWDSSLDAQTTSDFESNPQGFESLPFQLQSLEAILVVISLALCAFKQLRFEIAALPMCDLAILSPLPERSSLFT